MSDIAYQRFREMLKSHDLFMTAPRNRVFQLLQRHPALSLKELVTLTKAHDQATVYRTVNLFEQLGIVARVRLGWHTKLELSDMFQHHHHHMSCIQCGNVVDLHEDKLIEQEIIRLGQQFGFQPTDHQLEIRGICQRCQQMKKLNSK